MEPSARNRTSRHHARRAGALLIFSLLGTGCLALYDTPSRHPSRGERTSSPQHSVRETPKPQTRPSPNRDNERNHPSPLPNRKQEKPKPPARVQRLPVPSYSAKLLQRAIESYKQFDYHSVIRTADQIQRTEQSTPKERVEAALLAGASSYLLGNERAARAYFQKAKTIAPGCTPNSRFFPPRVCQLYEDSDTP
jgi:hypothetical protein